MDVAEDENVRQWVLESDRVLVRAVAVAVGAEGLAKLTARFLQEEAYLDAAKVHWAAAAGQLQDSEAGRANTKAALALIDAGADGAYRDETGAGAPGTMVPKPCGGPMLIIG